MRTLPLRMVSLLLLALAPLALQSAACSAGDGVTPLCTDNLDPEQGIVKMGDGCYQFPHCIVNGTRAAPEECCKNEAGMVNQECVRGYAPLSSASTTTSSTTTTTSSGAGGTGGEGGGGGPGGSAGGGGSGDAGGPAAGGGGGA